jgi:hypothetical protein
MSKKPKCVTCPACGGPATDTSLHITRVGDKPERVKHVDLLTPLKDLVHVIRDFQCGDYSPIMDEIFDAEHAIALAERKPRKGIDYD